MIVALSGPPGVGKTHWIAQHLRQHNSQNARYFSPKTETLPLDAVWLGTEFPALQVLQLGQEAQLLASFEGVTYLELPWYLDLAGIEPLLQSTDCDRIAILPPQSLETPWHDWADRIHSGNPFTLSSDFHQHPPQIHRIQLNGKVLDFESLAVFWYELLQGAYGEVMRAKGILEIASGEAVYGDFVRGRRNDEFPALDWPQWLEGRPQRLSGLEICGDGLQRVAIVQTLEDCCLSDEQLHYYQQQIRASLDREPEVTVI
ncbi:MAG: GTP-binding protein [Cyanobacteria bacterium SBLK]|nr:GTP-binding protein [Cyanobacteria bacterium SBLK]